jgi:hypothetical protein
MKLNSLNKELNKKNQQHTETANIFYILLRLILDILKIVIKL